MIGRRGFLTGLLAAPAIVRPGILMPIKMWTAPGEAWFIVTYATGWGYRRGDKIKILDEAPGFYDVIPRRYLLKGESLVARSVYGNEIRWLSGL